MHKWLIINQSSSLGFKEMMINWIFIMIVFWLLLGRWGREGERRGVLLYPGFDLFLFFLFLILFRVVDNHFSLFITFLDDDAAKLWWGGSWSSPSFWSCYLKEDHSHDAKWWWWFWSWVENMRREKWFRENQILILLIWQGILLYTFILISMRGGNLIFVLL